MDNIVVIEQGEEDSKELSKSSVENIGKRSNKDKRWQGGTGTGSGHLLFGDKRAVRIHELRNLVLRNMFKTQVENAIKKQRD